MGEKGAKRSWRGLGERWKTTHAPWNPSSAACSPALKRTVLHLLPCLVKKGAVEEGILAGCHRREERSKRL
jgi:hypothetical protein